MHVHPGSDIGLPEVRTRSGAGATGVSRSATEGRGPVLQVMGTGRYKLLEALVTKSN